MPSPNKLTPEFKAKWCDLLRSDTFIQHKGGLYDPKDTRALCCIAVGACALRGVREITEIAELRCKNESGEGDQTNVATSMLGILGLEVPDPNTEDGDEPTTDAQDVLVNMNDTQGNTFAEIADWIEVNL